MILIKEQGYRLPYKSTYEFQIYEKWSMNSDWPWLEVNNFSDISVNKMLKSLIQLVAASEHEYFFILVDNMYLTFWISDVVETACLNLLV